MPVPDIQPLSQPGHIGHHLQQQVQSNMSSIQPDHVMIYVQHLLGIGHLRRIWFLACALAERDIAVDLVTGGMPIEGLIQPGVNMHQLPPVRSLDSSFNQLIDERDNPVDEAWKENRRDHLLALYELISPRLLITETFPFGRRMMRFELLPLLEAARQSDKPPIIVASIRDILQPKSKAGRNEEVLSWVETYYDKIMIHGDPHIATLDLTFPLASMCLNKLNYTGYIVNSGNTRSDSQDGFDEVIISGGGGAASLKLLQTAIAAKPLSELKQHQWRILVGHNVDQNHFEQLQKTTDEGIIVERNRGDFPALLQRCALSVSQAGYNTVMDILQQQCGAVLVPFAEAGEVEQSLRAQQLQKRSRAACLEEHSLNPVSLSQAINAASHMTIGSFEINTNGASNSAQLIMDWLNA